MFRPPKGTPDGWGFEESPGGLHQQSKTLARPQRYQQPKSLASLRGISNPNRLLRAHLHMSTRSRSAKRTGVKALWGVWLRQGRDVLEPRNATVITGRLMQEHWPCPPPAQAEGGLPAHVARKLVNRTSKPIGMLAQISVEPGAAHEQPAPNTQQFMRSHTRTHTPTHRSTPAHPHTHSRTRPWGVPT